MTRRPLPQLLLLLAAPLFGLAAAASAQPPSVSPAPLPTASSGAAPKAEVSGEWLRKVAPAFAESARSGKPVLVDLYAAWCSWCQTMEEQVFSTPRFKEAAKRWVLLRVDVEDHGEGAALQARFNATTLPSTLLLDAARVRIGAIEGYQPLDSFLARLEQETAAWHELVDAFESGRYRSDRELFQRLVGEFHERGDGARAAVLYRELLAADPPESSRRWTLYMLADALRLAGDFSAAGQTLADAGKAASSAGDAELLERVDMLRFYLEQDWGRCAEAKSALETFLRDHPSSDQAFKARIALRDLRVDGGPGCI